MSLTLMPVESGEVAVTSADNSEASNSLLSIIARAARDPGVDVAKMSALLDMQERITARQAESEFNASMVRLAAQLPRIPKNGIVDLGSGKGRYNFAKWEDMDSAIRPFMMREGFTLSFDTRSREGGGAVVKGTLLHAGGHSRSAEVPLPLDTGAGRNNLQSMGSTLSYGRRYVTEMLLNLVREGADDDGQTGGVEYIDDAQAQQLRKLLDETKANSDAYLDYMGVQSLADIPKNRFAEAMNALMAKKRRAQP